MVQIAGQIAKLNSQGRDLPNRLRSAAIGVAVKSPRTRLRRRIRHPFTAEFGRESQRASRTDLDAAQILASVGEVAYDWRIDSDVLLWGDNAADVLLIPDVAAISTGRGYAQILEAENAQARFDAVMQSDKRDDGHGVAYQIQYGIRPDPASETRLWVEDTGRWFAGPDGKPAARARRAARHQRALRARTSADLSRALRRLDRRVQPPPPHRSARRHDRRGAALSLLLRLSPGCHRQSGAHQRVLRLRHRR